MMADFQKRTADDVDIGGGRKRKRVQLTSTSARKSAPPAMRNIFERDPPSWPSNDITVQSSQTRINALEHGDQNEKLMAMFARHVISPGSHRRTGTKWVSRKSLYRAFPEHFNQFGFLQKSPWKSKSASDFGLPDLFLRSVDDELAKRRPREIADQTFEDSLESPAVEGLTVKELQWLEQRSKPCRHDSCLHTEHAPSTAPHESGTYESPPQASSRSSEDRGQLREFKKKEATTLRNQSINKRTPGLSSPAVFNLARSIKPELSTTSSTVNGEQLEQAEVTKEGSIIRHIVHSSNNRKSATRFGTKSPIEDLATRHSHKDPLNLATPTAGAPPSSSNTSQAVLESLIPKISEILTDFPTSHENKAFTPLLGKVVTAAMANDTSATEEALLELETDVVTNTINQQLMDDQNAIAVLVRQILKALGRCRMIDLGSTHSENKKTVNRMSIARDVDGLRDFHARMLIWQAQLENDLS